MSTEMEVQVCERVLERSEDDVDVAQKTGRIGVDAIAADAVAKSKQLVYASENGLLMCNDQGNDPRFLVHRGEPAYVVDTLHGTKKEITFDFSKVAEVNRPNQAFSFRLYDICFLPNDKVLGIVIFDNANFLFDGKLDFVSCRLTINLMIDINEFGQGTFLVNEAESRVYLLLELGLDRNLIFEVQTTNNALTLTNTIRLPSRLYYPTVQNNRLFGFRWGGREIDTTKLVEVSLTDGTEFKHRTTVDGQIGELIFDPFTYVWSKNTLFASQYDRNRSVSTVIKFDLCKLKWTITNMEVEGIASRLSIAGSVLTLSCKLLIVHEYFYYQFHMNKVDSLANLVWRSVHQYTHSNPLFTEWLVSKLPINSRFRQ